ncbi:MAG: amidohydrolase family protein, partial [Pseudomonadota bacterium]
MIDAHHHVWRQHDLPWLLGPEQPRIFGSYGAIKRDYPMTEYLADLRGTGIEKSVYVQANWAPNWFEDEVAWVSGVAAEHGWPHGIVGYADFTVADVRPQLDRLTKYPLMRGIRQQLHWHEEPLYRFAPRPDLGSDPVVQKNVALLGAYGWSFDLQLFAGQM